MYIHVHVDIELSVWHLHVHVYWVEIVHVFPRVFILSSPPPSPPSLFVCSSFALSLSVAAV